MAKPLGPKSRLIREAIKANPGTKNKALAELINSSPDRKSDKIKVTPNDVAQQRTALKQSGGEASKPASSEPAKKKPGRPKKNTTATPAIAPRAVASPAASIIAMDLIDKAYALATECGGVQQLKRLVDRMAAM
jgi:hypothetical protein